MVSSLDGAGPHVLRLCSVFEPPPSSADPGGALDHRTARFDPIGGMQNHTAALTRCLDAQGHRQTVLTSRLSGSRGVQRLGNAAEVHRTGVRTTRLRQGWALAALPRVLARRPGSGTAAVDVVHAHQGEDLAVLLLARVAARRHRCPLVVTVHCSVGHTVAGGSLHVRLLRAVGGGIERATLRRADAVVVLTRRTATALEAVGVCAERIVTIPSGFEPSVFASTATGGPATRPRVRIGYVGRMAPQKRVDLLVTAFGQMRETCDLVLVGDGPERARVQRLVRQSPAADRISLTGFVEHAAVPQVLAGLDLLVLPSAYEEMGSVLVEAMVAGVPVVASDVGGIPEVVRHGETGLLVPPGDVAALAGALDRLAADARLRARLAAGARRRSREYRWPQLAARVADVYRRAGTGDAVPAPAA